MEKGLFISFEGGDCAGKSTQIGLLTKHLEEQGREVVYVREPGGTFLGEKVRDLLKSHNEDVPMCVTTELLLFSASRAQLVNDVIVPSVEAGKVVIADRFFDSTVVYQGTRGVSRDEIEAATRIAVKDHSPDCTFLLDVPVSTVMERLANRNEKTDRFETVGEQGLERFRQAYLDQAAANPERIHVIDATRSKAEIFADVSALLGVVMDAKERGELVSLPVPEVIFSEHPDGFPGPRV